MEKQLFDIKNWICENIAAIIILLVIVFFEFIICSCLIPYNQYILINEKVETFSQFNVALFVGLVATTISLFGIYFTNKTNKEILNRQLNDANKKSASITLKSIIEQLIILEPTNLQKNKFKLSKWVIENLIDDKIFKNYYNELKKNYKTQFSHTYNHYNKEKRELKEICRRTAIFYEKSMYYELPKSVKERLDNLKDEKNINIANLEKLNEEIKSYLKNHYN